MAKKTKVVHLITRLDIGGAQGNTLYTVGHLNPNQYEVYLWYGPGGAWDDKANDAIGSSGRLEVFRNLVRPIHPIKDFLVVNDLRKALRKVKPDIIHTHSSKAGIVGRYAAWKENVPLIVHTFHGFGFNYEQSWIVRNFFQLLERRMARYTNALVFVSNSNKKDAANLKIGQESIYHLIRSGIPLNNFIRNQSAEVRTIARNELGLNGRPVLLTVGPLKPQKNLEDFIMAVVRLKKNFPNIKAYIAGEGEQRPKIEGLIKKFDLPDNVELLGWRDDISNLMAAADVFVLTSLWEGLPRSLVEALASGVPAVCYATDGVCDLLPPDGGVIVKKKDLETLVKNIGQFLTNRELALKFSQVGASSVQAEFDIDNMVRQQEKLYEMLLNQYFSSR